MSQDPTTTILNVTNTTDSTLIFLGAAEIGHVSTNSSYPSQIPSKATVTFYHVGTPNSAGIAAYRSIVSADKAFDIFILWSNQSNISNGVWTSVATPDYVSPERRGAIFQQGLLKATLTTSVSTHDGLTLAAEIEQTGNFPTLSATISYNP